MTLYMETTKIPAEKTAQEIVHLLSQAGASSVLTEYKDKKIAGLAFRIVVKGNQIPFLLPVKIEPVWKQLQQNRAPMNRAKNAERDREQAERVAWRQILKWIQAQLALIETDMVSVAEVFLPYAQVGPSETLYQRLESKGFQALPAPEVGP